MLQQVQSIEYREPAILPSIASKTAIMLELFTTLLINLP